MDQYVACFGHFAAVVSQILPYKKKKKGIGYTRGYHYIRTVGAPPDVPDCVGTLNLDFGLSFTIF